MRSILAAAIVLAQALGLATLSAGQSLGDVARQEEARRKTIPAPSKVYTNESLRDEAPPAPPSTTAAAPAATPAAEPDDDAAPAATAPPRDEKYWRGRIETARTALTRARTFQEALQTRINSLSADFVNRDDPAQRNVIAAERQKALAELDRLKQEIADTEKAIAAIEEDARRANVPPGWLR